MNAPSIEMVENPVAIGNNPAALNLRRTRRSTSATKVASDHVRASSVRWADAVFALLVLAATATGQDPATPAQLPDASQPQTSAPSQDQQTSSSSKQAPASNANGSGVIAILPPTISHKPLTAEDKFQIYTHQTVGPQDFIFPAFGAGFFMLNPPDHYPREWENGGGAFGRWYGEQIVAGTSNRTGQFLAEVALHEDPRYVPSASKNALLRTFHAVAFTFVDKTDSGHNTFALSNLAGAAAGGFVGMGILPAGYNDVTHAERRALRGLESDAIRNIITEYRPEWGPVLKRIHVPRILPEWWTPKRPQHP